MRRVGGRERGSALLIVLVFAAIIAIGLYAEMPVLTFESQRQKEQLLIDRGNEYARGVKLYVRKIQQYPPSFEALENTNRMRFLRKRYKDPFTGKDDWRLLHAGPGGIIIDSKVNPVAANGTNGANGPNNLGSPTGSSPGNTGFSSPGNANSGFGGSNNNNASATSAFGGFNSGPSSNSNNNVNNGTGNNAPGSVGAQNPGGFGGSNSGNGTNSNAGFGGYLSSLNANANGNTNPGANPGNPQMPSGAMMRQRAAAIAANGATGANQANPGIAPGAPGSLPSDDPSGNPPVPTNSDPNSNVQNGPGMRVSAGQNAPQNSSGGNNQGGPFNNQTGPFNNQNGPSNNQNGPFNNRPAPGQNMAGGLGAPSSSSGLGVIQSGGIAGVASKAEGASIKSVNDQESYKLWEFVYDMSKDNARQMAGAINQTGAAAGAGNPGNTGFAQGNGAQGNGTQGNSAFGNSGFGGSGFGNGQRSGFGNSNNNGFGSSNNNGFGNSNSGFGGNNNGFGSSNNNGFGNSNNNGFGNSNSGFGGNNNGFGSSGSSSGNPSNNGWSSNSNSNSQSMGTSTTARPQQQY